MKTKILSIQELEYIECMCEASNKLGINWPRAVHFFPAQTKEEKRWKKRMLLGIKLVMGQSSAIQSNKDCNTKASSLISEAM